MRHIALLALGLIATGCVASPQRESTISMDPAVIDSGYTATPNNCETPRAPFMAESAGYHEGLYEGFGVYRYDSFNGLTSITLRTCNPGPQPEFLKINFFGASRMDVGEHTVTGTAQQDGLGVDFIYTLDMQDDTVRCSELPSGVVNIESSDAERITGTFEITLGCRDLGNSSMDELGPTVFAGAFEALNNGAE